MRVSIRYRVSVLLSVLSVVSITAFQRADGQQVGENFRATFGMGSTVSVSTLRIPEKAWKHFVRAQSAAEHNRPAETERETQKAIEIAPNFALAYLLRADSEVQEHSFEAAIANVREARRVEPDVLWAGVVLAGAYNGLRRFEEARLVLQQMHRADAEAWQAAYEGARAAVGLKDVKGALHWSEVALDAAPPNFTDARLVRANALVLAHRWSDAEAQMETYLKLKVPDERRAQVLIALDTIKQRVRDEELQKIASR